MEESNLDVDTDSCPSDVEPIPKATQKYNQEHGGYANIMLCVRSRLSNCYLVHT